MSATLKGESGHGLFVIKHHCLHFINLWRAGRTQRHKTWYVEYKLHPNAAPKTWSQSVRWGCYNIGYELERLSLPSRKIFCSWWYLHISPKLSWSWNCDYLNIKIPHETLKYTSIGKIWIYPMSKKWSKIHQKDMFSIHSEEVLRGTRMKVFLTSFLDVV